MSYLRNSRFRGIFPNAAALPAAQVEEGSTTYVTDTNGLTGGASGVAGHVHWNGSQWVVHDLEKVLSGCGCPGNQRRAPTPAPAPRPTPRSPRS